MRAELQQELQACHDKLAAASNRLWEESLKSEAQGCADMLLPPSLLQAAMLELKGGRAEGAGQPAKPTWSLKPLPPASSRQGFPRPFASKEASHRRGVHVGTDPSNAAHEPRPPPKGGQVVAEGVGSPRRVGSARGPATSAEPTRSAVGAASRGEVVRIGSDLDRRIKLDGETLPAYDAAFEAMAQRARTRCAEEGALLERVRIWLLRHSWWLEKEARDARAEGTLPPNTSRDNLESISI
jgi:hypothetical protein